MFEKIQLFNKRDDGNDGFQFFNLSIYLFFHLIFHIKITLEKHS